MGDSPQLEIEIVMPDGSISKAFGKIRKNAEDAGEEGGKKYGDKFSKGVEKSVSASDVFKGAFFANLATGAIRGAVQAAKEFGKGLVAGGSEMERYNTQLSVLLGSSEKAAKHLSALAKFSASTPFQLPGIVETSKMLLSFGFTQDKVMDSLQKIGDVAAISGNGLKELALVYGQVSAAGKLTGERLLQFQERGVPIVKALASELGVAESAVKDMVSSGQIDFKKFEKAFASLSKEGGLFYQGMVKQSETFEGVQSTLSDSISLIYSGIGRSMIPAMKEASKLAIEMAGDILKWVDENKLAIEKFSKEVITGAVVALKELVKIGKVAFDFLRDHGAVLLTAVAVFKVGEALVAAKTAVMGLNLVMAANPLGLIALGAAAAVAALKGLVDLGTDRATDGIYKLNRAVVENEKETAKLEKTLQNLIHGQKASGKVSAETGELQDAAARKFKKSIEDKIEALRREREELQKNLDMAKTPAREPTGNGEPKEPTGKGVDNTIDVDITEMVAKQRELEEGAGRLSNVWAEQTNSFSNYAKAQVKTAKQMAAEINAMLFNTLVNGAGQAFASFGKALVEGEDGLKAMGKTFISMLGQMSVQMGTMFIAQGAAMLFSMNPVWQGQAVPLMAAGAALATLGGAMQAFGSSSSSGAASSGATSSGAQYESSPSATAETTKEKAEPITTVSVNIQGNVLDSSESGMRIVKMINEAVGKNGARLVTA